MKCQSFSASSSTDEMAQKIAWQMAEFWYLSTFLPLNLHQPYIPMSCIEHHLQTKSILQFLIPNNISWPFPKSCNRQKTFCILIIKVSSLVTFPAELVSFHKQNCVGFRGKLEAQFLLNYWTSRPQTLEMYMVI
jgi:hypothetical protein